MDWQRQYATTSALYKTFFWAHENVSTIQCGPLIKRLGALWSSGEKTQQDDVWVWVADLLKPIQHQGSGDADFTSAENQVGLLYNLNVICRTLM